MTVGLVVGGVIGGLGGRLAMRILVLTSDDRLDGRLTDDLAVVNQFTLGGTVGFIIFMALGGAALALVYLVIRRWLPRSRRGRAIAYGLLFWAIQGEDMFESESFDFDLLEPGWLAVTMFTLIIFGAGALIALRVERYADGWPTRKLAYLPIALLLPAFPVFVPIAIAGGVAWILATQPAVARVWRSMPVTVVGAVALAAIGLVNGLPAVREVIRIVT